MGGFCHVVASGEFAAIHIVADCIRPHAATAKKARGARTVSREAVSSITAMVEASPSLQNMRAMNTERAREVLGSADAYRLLGERLEMLGARVKYTAEARWAEVVAQAMHAYSLASILAEDQNDTELAAHVQIVRRNLRRRNAASAKAKEGPETEVRHAAKRGPLTPPIRSEYPSRPGRWTGS